MNFSVDLLKYALYKVRKQYQEYTLKIEETKLKRATLKEEFDHVMSTIDIPDLNDCNEIKIK